MGATEDLIGSIVRNMRHYQNDFVHNVRCCKYHKPEHMNGCNHPDNTRIVCSWSICPLGGDNNAD